MSPVSRTAAPPKISIGPARPPVSSAKSGCPTDSSVDLARQKGLDRTSAAWFDAGLYLDGSDGPATPRMQVVSCKLLASRPGDAEPGWREATWYEDEEDASTTTLRVFESAPDDVEELAAVRTNAPMTLFGGDPFLAPALTISGALGKTLAQQRRGSLAGFGCFLAPKGGLCHC
eukprot:TRINITY_DN64704_c0_g1_i1.p2 TRINITY_DN64704_c0_g1~~TRINITY_DN64704_c0_g1_i1.p2  ORF type:complete len:174 (+),score=27.45 TRINITY_DN64704_c0_g1_i1:173-694(+)